MKFPYSKMAWVTHGPAMGQQDAEINLSDLDLPGINLPKTIEVQFPGREFPTVYRYTRSNSMLGYTVDWIYLTEGGERAIIVRNDRD